MFNNLSTTQQNMIIYFGIGFCFNCACAVYEAAEYLKERNQAKKKTTIKDISDFLKLRSGERFWESVGWPFTIWDNCVPYIVHLCVGNTN
jgi:hypothetical protein